MAIRREWLDWNKPFLPQAAAWLLKQAPASDRHRCLCDLRAITCVLSGSRGGRLLLTELLTQCKNAGRTLIPPRILTPGSLLASLTEDLPIASELESLFAWAQAIQRSKADDLLPLLPADRMKSDAAAAHDLARAFASVHADLAGSQITFVMAAECAERMEMFAEGERWRALAALHQTYLKVLHESGLRDSHDARSERVQLATHEEIGEQLVLMAVPELNAIQRQFIGSFDDRAIALIHAPSTIADRFDSCGCVIAEKWSDVDIGIDDSQLHLVDRPSDQAAQAMRCIESLGGRFAANEIVIGAGDETLIPFIDRAAEWCDVQVRSAAGRPLRESRPLRFLEAAGDWLADPRFANFAALVRHPDVMEHIAAHDMAGAANDWIDLLDDYFCDHLHERLTGEWLGNPEHRTRLKHVYDITLALIAPLRTLFQSGSRTPELRDWAIAFLAALANLYGDNDDAAESCDTIRNALTEIAAVPAALHPSGEAPAMFRIMLDHLFDSIMPEDVRVDQIDILGFLELHLDPSRALIITGVNDGCIPHTTSAGPFLPDALRAALNMPTQADRYARDAYLMEAIRHHRESLAIIAGRRSANNDPLTPSRLLLACNDRTLINRVLMMCDERATGIKEASKSTELLQFSESAFVVPSLPPLTAPSRMSVTEFRMYLQCPYRYALARLLDLRSLTDDAVEMDALAFGSLAHEVLCAFGKDATVADSTDHTAIERFLLASLDEIAHEKFGSAPMPSVRVQLARLQQRLRSFAVMQANHRTQGWRIRDCEVEFSGAIALDIPGQDSMPLRAKIDRIDFNEKTGKWLIIDYKTGESGDSPHKTHHGSERIGESLEWLDLQLPLYHFLATRSPLGVADDATLAYFCLPKQPDGVALQVAEWTADHLQHAHDAAREVVRNIRAGNFVINPDFDSRFDQFARICQTTVFSAMDEDAEEVAA